MALKCLLVDDEPLAHTVLETYMTNIHFLQLAGKCYNAMEAINFLHQNEVDLMFLDIQMPTLTGLEMLKTLSKPPAVILTTAYSEFALESYEFGVIDYLLKPIRFERFLKAVNKVALQDLPAPAEVVLVVKADGITHKLLPANISHIEAYGNFVKIYVAEKFLVVADTMTDIHTRLPTFVRVHKSFLLNPDFLSAMEGNRLFLKEGIELPLGLSYKQSAMEKLWK